MEQFATCWEGLEDPRNDNVGLHDFHELLMIDQRAGASAETSYTRSLLDKGAAHCARKFGEEAVELAIAAAALDEGAVRAEAADVLYHLLVVLRARDVALSSVIEELGQTIGTRRT